MTYGKILLKVLLFIVLAIIGIWLFLYIKMPTVIENARQTAKRINAQCPTIIYTDTRLDSVVVIESPVRTFKFNCTLLDTIQDPIGIQRTKDYFEPRLKAYIKQDPQLNYLRKHRFVISYRYYNLQKLFLFESVFVPSKYLEN